MKRLNAALVLAACATFASCLRLDSFLFTATPLDAYTLPYGPNWPAMMHVPENLRTVQSYTGSDGTVVWFVWCVQPSMATVPTVIYHHGQSDNLDRYWERASLIWSLGVNVLIYDYPSYGKTPGSPSEATVYQTSNAVLEWVHALGAQIDQSRIFHYGFSMGSGPATQMAATTGPTRGLVLESAFTSIDALVADGTLVVPRSFVLTNTFDNLSKIRRAAENTQLGVLLFHGDSDTYVQTAYGIQLDATIAETDPTRHQLVLIQGADHDEVPCIPPGDSPCTPRPLDGPYATNLRAFLFR